jgi:tRNA pseudouridine32 synthase / 23S rRNA pseudouridine746 synthase
MFSCQPATRNIYHALFEQRQIHKTYHAIAATRRDLVFPLQHCSRLESAEEFFRMAEVTGKHNSETHIQLLEERGEHSLYQLNPVTGKKHQLRVHMTALGMPLMNDVLYPAIRDAAHDDFSQPLQLLAKQLQFRDPVTGEPYSFSSKQSL